MFGDFSAFGRGEFGPKKCCVCDKGKSTRTAKICWPFLEMNTEEPQMQIYNQFVNDTIMVHQGCARHIKPNEAIMKFETSPGSPPIHLD